MEPTPLPVESSTRASQRSLTMLQRRRTYPSVTVLLTTPNGVVPDAAALGTAQRLIKQADDRLHGGDRYGLDIDRNPAWPLVRTDEHTTTTWRQAAVDTIRTHQQHDR